MSKLFCTKNVGDRERLLRAILGMVFFYFWASGSVMGLFGIVTGILGVALIVTAATGCCAVYCMINKSSCETGGSCTMHKH